MEPIDENTRPTKVGAGVPVLPIVIANKLYRPRPEDWGGDRDSECDRISVELSKLMGLAIAKPFVSPVDLNRHPSYASIVQYPIDLSTIKYRLDNRFYRRQLVVEFDINYIVTNARKFHHKNSDIIRSASIVTDICLEILHNRYPVDATYIYHELLTKRKFRVKGVDSIDPSIIARTRNDINNNNLSIILNDSQIKMCESEEKTKSSGDTNGAYNTESAVGGEMLQM